MRAMGSSHCIEALSCRAYLCGEGEGTRWVGGERRGEAERSRRRRESVRAALGTQSHMRLESRGDDIGEDGDGDPSSRVVDGDIGCAGGRVEASGGGGA